MSDEKTHGVDIRRIGRAPKRRRAFGVFEAAVPIAAAGIDHVPRVAVQPRVGIADGMRFVQFYFGLPVAMIILSVTLVPFFYRAKVFTAYEYLERRFDKKTRALAGLLFLVSRGLAVGRSARLGGKYLCRRTTSG